MLKVLLEKGILERWAYVSYFTVCPLGGEDAAFETLSSAIQSSVPDFQQAGGKRLTVRRATSEFNAK